MQEYIDHRNQRECEILATLAHSGALRIPEIVAVVYVAYPKSLHAPAGQSVCSHLLKLESDGAVRRTGDEPLEATWERV